MSLVANAAAAANPISTGCLPVFVTCNVETLGPVSASVTVSVSNPVS